ncbi:MAG: hypothetical protein WCI73_15635 [Phycisphaerae bacterium]
MAGCAVTSKAPTKEYMFWPPQPEIPHVQFLMSVSSSSDVTGVQKKMDELLYGKDPTGDLPFERPYGVRISDGKIYVCDATAANVSILDFRKKEVRILGRTGQMTLQKPIDIAVAPDGVKYVADTGLGSVIVFDATDHYAGRITVPDLRPVAVAVYENELYVSDLKASRVRVFDRQTGKELRTIGEQGNGKGKLGGAMGLAIDRAGNVYVNDVVGCRVQKFTHDGTFISMLGGLGDHPGSFVRPKHMAVDSAGILYVVDAAFQNVQMFDAQNQMLMFFGSAGNHPGAMDMPTGIGVTDTDLDLFAQYVHPAFELQRILVVTNNYGPVKINIYGLGQLKPGKTPDDILSGRIKSTVGFADKPRNDIVPIPTTQAASQPATTTAPNTPKP